MSLELDEKTICGLVTLAKQSASNNLETSTLVTSIGQYMRFPEAPMDTYLVVTSQELTYSRNLFSVGDTFTILTGSVIVKLSEWGINKLLPYTPPNIDFDTQGLVYIPKGFFVVERKDEEQPITVADNCIYIYDKDKSDCLLVGLATLKIDGELIDFPTDFSSMLEEEK